MTDELKSITYVGYGSGKIVRFGKKSYEFEWRKGRGIGGREDEIRLEHAKKLSRWRDKKGRKIFIIE